MDTSERQTLERRVEQLDKERTALVRRVQQLRLVAAVLPPVASTFVAGFLGPEHYRAAVNLIIASVAVAGIGYWYVGEHYLVDDRHRVAQAHRDAADRLRRAGPPGEDRARGE